MLDMLCCRSKKINKIYINININFMDNDFELVQIPKNIKIHWVRHAESCSNVEFDELSGGMNIFGKIIKSVASTAEDLVNVAIQKTSQPPLTELGIYQAIMLGDFIEDDYNGYFSSPSTRTLLTLMIALESKYRRVGTPAEGIPVIIVENIIELQNIAGTIGQDKQNEALKPENLKIIINYLRNWLNHNFFNYYANIDKKFIELHKTISDKIKNLYIQDTANSNISDILLKLEQIDNCESVNSKERKVNILASVINLIYIHTTRDVVSEEEIIQLTYYTKLDRFDFIRFQILKLETTLKNSGIQEFIEYLITNHDEKLARADEKFLCLSHGSLLKKYFRLPRKLYNTEMIEQHCCSTSLNTATFKPDINLVSREKIVDITDILTQIQKCGKICGTPGYVKDREANNLFAVINKMSNYQKDISDPVLDSEVYQKFKIFRHEGTSGDFPYLSAEERGGYFKKYINILK